MHEKSVDLRFLEFVLVCEMAVEHQTPKRIMGVHDGPRGGFFRRSPEATYEKVARASSQAGTAAACASGGGARAGGEAVQKVAEWSRDALLRGAEKQPDVIGVPHEGVCTRRARRIAGRRRRCWPPTTRRATRGRLDLHMHVLAAVLLCAFAPPWCVGAPLHALCGAVA